MGRSSHLGSGLSESESDLIRLSVSAACRKMTADQILALADHLHEIIRKRCTLSVRDDLAVYDRRYASEKIESEARQ